MLITRGGQHAGQWGLSDVISCVSETRSKCFSENHLSNQSYGFSLEQVSYMNYTTLQRKQKSVTIQPCLHTGKSRIHPTQSLACLKNEAGELQPPPLFFSLRTPDSIYISTAEPERKLKATWYSPTGAALLFLLTRLNVLIFQVIYHSAVIKQL